MPSEPKRPTSLRGLVLAWLLLCVMAIELLSRQYPETHIHVFAWVLMGSIAVMSVPQFGIREAYLLIICGLLALYGWQSGLADAASFAAALEQAVFLVAFILLLGLLHQAASTSPAIRELGTYLTQQPQGRRYFALSGGTAVLAVLFNIGVVSFLVPLIQKGIATSTPNDKFNDIRERRQISAMVRGFAWVVIWSPTAMAPLALMELIPGVNRTVWILYGFVVFVFMMCVGALEDKLRFRHIRAMRKFSPPRFPTNALIRFLSACGWLIFLMTFFVVLTGDSIISGLLMSCPVMLVGWIVVQNGFSTNGFAESRARLKNIAFDVLPQSAPIAITLATSGFFGRLSAQVLPITEIAQWIGLDAVPSYLLLAALPVVLSLLSLLAFSPIMLAIFFGSFFAGLPSLPADPTLIALAISCGWSLSMTCSPFATVVLLTQQVGGIPARKLTWSWNLAFSALAALLMIPIFWVLVQINGAG